MKKRNLFDELMEGVDALKAEREGKSMCPFCPIPETDIVAGNASHIVIHDRFPVSPGHSLIIPRRHVASLFELTAEEFSALHELLHTTRSQLDAQYQPDGYNIGVNVGEAAGQTVFHLHVHVIPPIRELECFA